MSFAQGKPHHLCLDTTCPIRIHGKDKENFDSTNGTLRTALARSVPHAAAASRQNVRGRLEDCLARLAASNCASEFSTVGTVDTKGGVEPAGSYGVRKVSCHRKDKVGAAVLRKGNLNASKTKAKRVPQYYAIKAGRLEMKAGYFSRWQFRGRIESISVKMFRPVGACSSVSGTSLLRTKCTIMSKGRSISGNMLRSAKGCPIVA